ncbi:MAG: ABC transporter ATP-binding protein [Anaerolineaceae bacterium]|nr:ABC transporter ATP-binding protein [Anaerolineaceae bacterium]
MIEIEDLWFEYPDKHPALRGIDLRVGTGEKIALVGLNGAGKSTLLLQLNGILRGRGKIRIAGTHLTPATAGQVRALVGMVFQSPDDQLFSPTVFEDVAFGPLYQGLPMAEIELRVRAALKAVGMQNYAERSSYHLSLGEKKRIAIATVLSMQPKILVLDEPSAGLDPRARRSLIALLQELPYTMVIATHDLELVRELATRTLVMSEGKIVADGATTQTLEDEGILRNFLL